MTPSVLPGDAQIVPPRVWLRTHRRRLGLRHADVEARTTELQARISTDTLSHLETGRVPFTALNADQILALRRVLGITAQAWADHAGSDPLSTPQWLRALRLQRGLRQIDVTERTAALHGRINQATVSQLETGQFHPAHLTAAQVEALCAVLAITPAAWAAQVAGSSGGATSRPRSHRRYRPPARDGQ